MNLVEQGRAEARALSKIEVYPDPAGPSFFAPSVEYSETVPQWLQWLPYAEHCRSVTRLVLSRASYRSGYSYDTPRPSLASRAQLVQINKLTGLKRLALWGTKVTHEDLRVLDRLRNLELLDVHQCPGIDQDELAMQIEQWPKLRRIALGTSDSHLTASGSLGGNPGRGVTNRGLERLARTPWVVQELKIRGFNERSLDYVMRLKRLVYLEIELAVATDPHILNALYRLPHLRNLRIIGIDGAPLAFLQKKNPALKIYFDPVHYKNMSELTKRWWSRVNTLCIAHNMAPLHHSFRNHDDLIYNNSNYSGRRYYGFVVYGFGDGLETPLFAKVEDLSDFNQPDYSQISRVLVRRCPDFIPHLKRFDNLKQLNVRATKINDSQFLKELPGLEHLELTNVSLQPNQKVDLGCCPELRSILFQKLYSHPPSINDALKISNIVGWEKAKRLRRVYLWCFEVADETIDRIVALNALEELVFPRRSWPISSAQIETLAANKNLKTCILQPNEELAALIREKLPHISNYVGRSKAHDPAEPRYPKAFARLVGEHSNER